jgi:flagellar hook-associated protein 1 FlgK
MGLDVVGQNLANINTPGYARRTLDLAEVPPVGPTSAGRGVEVVAVRAMRDQLVDARLRREQGDSAYDSAMAEILGTVEAAIGMPGSSLDAQLTAFFGAFTTLSNDPTSAVARDGVVREGQALASAFQGLVGQLKTVQQDADASMRASVEEVNRLGAELADLNVHIASSSFDQEALRDRQGVILGRLGELADVAVLARADGGVDVTLRSGRALVLGEKSYAMDVTPTGLATVSQDGVDITAELNGGRIGGLRQVRDTIIPGYLNSLDQLAFDLAGAVNAVHNTGFDAAGAPAGNFFATPAGLAGAAEALAVDPALVANSALVAASATGATGDNGIARQLAAMRDTKITAGGTQSAFGAWRSLAYAVGNDVAAARAAQTSHSQIVTQLQALQAQASGVSYDEEAAHLMRYQRAYEANARYFQTINDTLEVLMGMVR